MSNVIECICRLLPNRVLITVPTIEKDRLFRVVGLNDLDTILPKIVVKDNKPEAKATYNVPYKFVGSIIVNDFENGEDKN